jgi:integrase
LYRWPRREKAIEYRKLARSGGDPIAAKRSSQRTVPTFRVAAEKVHTEHEPTWRNAKHGQQWLNTLKQYAYAEIGDKRVDQIDTPDILRVLSPIWLTKAETARRVRQRIGSVFDWAKAAGYRTGDNPIEGVTRGLPKQAERGGHHEAMSYMDVPAFVKKLRATQSELGKLAFEFLILTATRTSEVLEARWDEIDSHERLWIIPAARMKAKSDDPVARELRG